LSGLKILELERQDESGDSRVYHHLNVKKEIYRMILKLKKNIDPLRELSEVLGKQILNRKIRPFRYRGCR